MGFFVFVITFVLFYGLIIWSSQEYDYDQENWWDGGNSEEEE